jgi:hypothetical protein
LGFVVRNGDDDEEDDVDDEMIKLELSFSFCCFGDVC